MTNKDQTKPYDYEIDLERITDSPIVRIVGYVSREFGDPTFKMTRVITADGQSFHAEGEHDIAYLTDLDEAKLKEFDPDSGGDEESNEDD